MLKIGAVQNGTQRDLDKMTDMVKIWGQNDRPNAENGWQNRGAHRGVLTYMGEINTCSHIAQ